MFSDQHVTKPRPKNMNIKSFSLSQLRYPSTYRWDHQKTSQKQSSIFSGPGSAEDAFLEAAAVPNINKIVKMRFQRFWLHSQAYKSVLDRPYRPKPTDRATRPDPTGRQTDPTNPRPTDQPTDPTRPGRGHAVQYQWIVLKNNNNILILYNFPLYCTARPRWLGTLGWLAWRWLWISASPKTKRCCIIAGGSWRTPVFLLHPILPKNRGIMCIFFRGLAREGWQNEENTFLDQHVTNLRPKSMNAKSFSLSKLRYPSTSSIQVTKRWLALAGLARTLFVFLNTFPLFLSVTKRGKHVFGSTCDETTAEKHEHQIIFFITTTIPFDIYRWDHQKTSQKQSSIFRGPDLPRMHF